MERVSTSTSKEQEAARKALRENQDKLAEVVEQALTKRQNQLDSIIKAAPVGIGVVVSGILCEVNDTLGEMTGYRKEEILGKSPAFFFLSQEEFENIEKNNHLRFLDQSSSTLETSWRKKDGSIIEIMLSLAVINTLDPTEGVTFTALDITDKKRAEIALKESEEKYRLIAENTADTIAVLDFQFQFKYVSPSIVNLCGYSVEELLSLELCQLLTKDSRQKANSILKEEMALVNSGNDDPFRSRLIEFEVFHKNGVTIWIESKVSFIRDENSNPQSLLTVSRDISKRKQAEQLIYKQKAEFEALFTNTNDAMIFFDMREITINLNSQFTRMFGYEYAQAIGQNVNSLIDPQKNITEYASTKILKGQTIVLETVRYTKSGRAIPVNLKGGPVYIDGVITGGYTVYTDISERKRYEEELKYLSLHDKLTGLYNRAFFEAELNRLASGRDYPITIISADVDGLKLINDSLGHDSGDELLKVCAKILRKSLRSSDILARIGGDEFTVVLPNTDNRTGEELILRIRTNVEQYNRKHRQKELSISIGLATADNKEDSLNATFKRLTTLCTGVSSAKPAVLNPGLLKLF